MKELNVTRRLAKILMYNAIFFSVTLLLFLLNQPPVGSAPVVVSTALFKSAVISAAICIIIVYLCERYVFEWRIESYKCDKRTFESESDARNMAFAEASRKYDVAFISMHINRGMDKRGHWLQLRGHNVNYHSKRYYFTCNSKWI